MSKFLGKKVQIRYAMGCEIVRIEGYLRSFRMDSLHCVIDTEKDSVMIRLPLEIVRKRGQATLEGAKESMLVK